MKLSLMPTWSCSGPTGCLWNLKLMMMALMPLVELCTCLQYDEEAYETCIHQPCYDQLPPSSVKDSAQSIKSVCMSSFSWNKIADLLYLYSAAHCNPPGVDAIVWLILILERIIIRYHPSMIFTYA